MSKAENKIRKEMETDYPLIPMMEIEPEARMLAVAWVEGYEAQGMDIPGKQKLASDIMNYARRHQSPSKDSSVLVEALDKIKVIAKGGSIGLPAMLKDFQRIVTICTESLAQYNAVEPEKKEGEK